MTYKRVRNSKSDNNGPITWSYCFNNKMQPFEQETSSEIEEMFVSKLAHLSHSNSTNGLISIPLSKGAYFKQSQNQNKYVVLISMTQDLSTIRSAVQKNIQTGFERKIQRTPQFQASLRIPHPQPSSNEHKNDVSVSKATKSKTKTVSSKIGSGINGHSVTDTSYNKILEEGKGMIKSRVIGCTAHAIFTICMMIVGATSETIIKAVLYFIALFTFMYGWRWVYQNVVLKFLYSVRDNPLIWLAISALTTGYWHHDAILHLHDLQIGELATRVMRLEYGLGMLENRVDELGVAVRKIDEGMTGLQQFINETYIPMIEGDGIFQKMDTFVGEKMYNIFNKLSSKPLTRKEFGLGCFLRGTEIQLDEHGDTVLVENLVEGDFVYNPVLQRRVRIKNVIEGPEHGVLYEIETDSSLAVVVTETHPMKMCVGLGLRMQCDNNIAARDVHGGNWTLTVNGYQQINAVRKVAVEEGGRDMMVYNFMYDMNDLGDDVQVSSRAVVANGIVTLDLYAQKEHHNQDQQ